MAVPLSAFRLPNLLPSLLGAETVAERASTTDACCATLTKMIKSFRHHGIERFFRTGSKAGIQPAHAIKLEDRLYVLDNSKTPSDMNFHGWNLHPLKGNLEGHWSVKVDGNWRLTFAFDGEDAILVDYRDYH